MVDAQLDIGDGNFKKGRFNPFVILIGFVAVVGLAVFLFIGLKQDAEKLTVEQAEEQKKALFVLPKDEQIPKWREWAKTDRSDELRAEALKQLAWAKDPEGVDLAIAALKSESEPVQAMAATVLAEYGKPKVAYRQTPKKDIEVEGRHVKQSGGRGQFGVARVKFTLHDQTENTFESTVVGGSVPREYWSSVETGLDNSYEEGYPLGFPFVKLHANLYDGKYHDVDSSEMAFREAGRLALREATERAGVNILEPWMRIAITAPEVNLGDVIGSLNQRRGEIEKTERGSGDAMRIYGFVPLAEMFKYSEVLRGLSQGRGVYTLEPFEYRVVPQSIAEAIRKEVEEERKKRGK